MWGPEFCVPVAAVRDRGVRAWISAFQRWPPYSWFLLLRKLHEARPQVSNIRVCPPGLLAGAQVLVARYFCPLLTDS